MNRAFIKQWNSMHAEDIKVAKFKVGQKVKYCGKLVEYCGTHIITGVNLVDQGEIEYSLKGKNVLVWEEELEEIA